MIQTSSTMAISRFSSLFASSYHGSPGLRASAASSSCGPNNSGVWWRLIKPGGPIRGDLLSQSSSTSNLQPQPLPAAVLRFFDVKQNHVIMMNLYDFGKALGRRSPTLHKPRHRLSFAEPAEVKPSRKITVVSGGLMSSRV
jgi:hypothetical protein